MNDAIQVIPLLNLAIAFIPVIAIIFILYKWSLNFVNASYAIGRMLVQLLIIGYFLNFIFNLNSGGIVLIILMIMIVVSSWIALGVIRQKRIVLFKNVFIAIFIGGGITLLLVTKGVLDLSPWYLPQYMIPLAGMIFANSMNSVSLAAERLNSEISRGVDFITARKDAYQASLIPIINSLFAVGLVSIPGMMTGQILAGVEPLIAARYQIMVMCMIFGTAGISSALFLILSKSIFIAEEQKIKNIKLQ